MCIRDSQNIDREQKETAEKKSGSSHNKPLSTFGITFYILRPCHYISTSFRFVSTSCVTPMAATAIIKICLLYTSVNHCSDEHQWFVKAKQDPDCEEAGYFYFRRKEDGGEPNNWRSNFGGSVWTELPDGRWYFHTFSKKQPDLNWENPKLREKIYEMINWWLEKGVAGFRVDAITFIKKDLTFASRETEDGLRYPCLLYTSRCV